MPAGISDALFQHTIMKLQFAESETLLFIAMHINEQSKAGMYYP